MTVTKTLDSEYTQDISVSSVSFYLLKQSFVFLLFNCVNYKKKINKKKVTKVYTEFSYLPLIDNTKITVMFVQPFSKCFLNQKRSPICIKNTIGRKRKK